MKKKIAFISGWYSGPEKIEMTENHKFIIECLYNSGKKYFLPNHEVDFIFITNDERNKIEGVQNIVIDYNIVDFWHACLMKILCINYIDKEYDYVFVNDYDQFYVNEVTDDDILKDDVTILEHYYSTIGDVRVETINTVIINNKLIPLNFDTEKHLWTMGNFFGGKFELMKTLSKSTEQDHEKYMNLHFGGGGGGFYCQYPEELFLIKYIYENGLTPNLLSTNQSVKHDRRPVFQTQFEPINPTQETATSIDDISLHPQIYDIVKLVHNIKIDLDGLRNVIKLYV
jgi:hypothetical protein